MRKVCELGRSILPKSSADEKEFLSAVYKKGTQAKKHRLDVAQFGRSMVEMLGVLAIIGVLSVGGIAGYSKAMLKYKLNKQSEQLHTVMNAISRYYNKLHIIDDSTAGGQTYLIPYLRGLNEIPDEMYIKNNDNQIKDVFGNQYTIYSHDTGYIGMLINFNHSDYSVETCKNMHLTVKTFMHDVAKTMMRIDGTYTQEICGTKECTVGLKCYKDITLNDIDNACRNCIPDKECIYYVMWR
ncbi:MAG: type II secretion system protein [Alphaproteobacteria bacterium]|nr:type II secretion system protein [Alphaproteobacteria bacterium]